MDLELNTSTIMMLIFVFAFVISMWKIYAFLPNKQLTDDDTTPTAQAELLKIILKYLDKENVNTKELVEKVKNDEEFDKEHFWRFNENKLIQILNRLD
jgi:hypothetical protein